MTTWHAAPEILARFATTPEAVDDVTASSIEAHLLACDECRRTVAAAADPTAVAAEWDGIVDRIDRPRPALAERVLARFVPDHVARIVAATPALRLSWLAAVAVVVGAVVAVARQTGNDTPFLLLAPLVPLAGVAVSFGPAPDPAGETALATPLHGAGLVLRRTAAVLATSAIVLVAGSLALPGLELRDAGWVLPAVGLTAGALAFSTWLAPTTAAALAAAAWLATVQTTVVADHVGRSVAEGPLFGPPGQLTFAVMAAIALAALRTRRARLSMLEARR
jgi:hypothetical protein